MILRLANGLAMQRPSVSAVSFVVSTIGLFGVFWVVPEIFWKFLANPSASELQYQAIGLILIILIILRSLSSDILILADRMEKIDVGTAIRGTRYDFQHFFDKKCKAIFIIAQNLRTLLSDPRVLPRLVELLEKNKLLRLTIILTVPKMMTSIDPEAPIEMKKTVQEMVDFYYKELSAPQRNRVTIRFHPGAMSLSAMIRDPDDSNRGLFVFTPKWATDREPGNRIYCILRKWKNPNIFNKLFGHMEIMTGERSTSLEIIAKELGVPVPEPSQL